MTTTAAEALAQAAELARSPRWEDRVHAHQIVKATEVTLPDGFPCIFETADSPRRRGLRAEPRAWVVSPDLGLLHALLPDYQELWDAYTSQWGPDSRRVFAVGTLDGLSPARVYEPGTTVEDVIGATLQTHGHEMYHRAPERLRAMHPRYEAWSKARTR